MDEQLNTRIVPAAEISLAATLLKQGDPVVFPTETVYGLGAPVFNESAVERIFIIKGRPADNPLIVHIDSLSSADCLIDEFPPSFIQLAEHFWPGPLTIILKKKGNVPSIVCGGQDTVAIRMPAHAGALELIRSVGQPIAAPSANRSGRPSPTCALDALEDLRGRVKLILDGGNCSIGIESTVISLNNDSAVLLRPGQITKENIEDVIKTKVVLSKKGDLVCSPGMKYRHYAPNARVRLVFQRKELNGPFILSLRPRPGERLLTRQTLYAEFRIADRIGVSEVQIDCCACLRSDIALMNRLLKASEGSK